MSEDDIQCYCDDDHAGHSLGEAGHLCKPLKQGRFTPFKQTKVASHADCYGWRGAKPTTYGTCRGCGKRKQVKRREMRGQIPGWPGTKAGPLLQVIPAIIDHKAGGETCSGSGQAAAETRYTPSRELDSWIREYGAEAVTA